MTLAQLETAMAEAQRVLLSPSGVATGVTTVDIFGVQAALLPVPGTSGATFSQSSSGAWPFRNAAAKWFIAHADFSSTLNTSIRNAPLIIADKLWGCSGYSATDTALKAITTSLPRGTGVGVTCWAEIYTVIGATPQNITVTYTNQAGTGSRTGTISLLAAHPAGTVIPMQMQGGDYGINSVQSFQLGGSTGTAGSYGLSLIRPVFVNISDIIKPSVLGAFQTGMPQFDNDACLIFLSQSASNAAPRPVGYMRLVE